MPGSMKRGGAGAGAALLQTLCGELAHWTFVQQRDILPQYSSSCLPQSPLSSDSLSIFRWISARDERAGVKFCWKSKEKLSWQTPSLLLRPEISRCWGKGRLVLKFPLITFSWGGQDGTRWLHCGTTVAPLPRQDIQWASLASSTVTPPGSNCSLSSISSITTRLTDSLLARL